MDVHPVLDEGLGNSAYVVDLGDGGALVVDPARDPRPYQRLLEQRGLTARFVVETHLHADFVSGGRELAADGAALLAPAGSELAHPHRPLHDGAEIDLGGLRLRALATPGHTPEHLAYVLTEGERPVAVFSGGTLIVGGVARTDLLDAASTEPLARAAYRSIHERLLVLPDDTPVHPTHGAGSFCSTGTGGERSTTVGRERATNPLLVGDPTEDEFVARLLAGFGPYPPYFLELRGVNRTGTTVHGPTPPRLEPLSLSAFDRAVADGAEVVDVRSMAAFTAGHVPGSLADPWRAQFATWLGWLVPHGRPVVFVADEQVDRDDLVWAALTVGVEHLVGELAGGVDAWTAAGRELTRTPLLRPADAGGRRLVDVRQPAEFALGHAPGAVNLHLGALAEDHAEPPEGPLLVHCGHGERATTAASLLERAGHRDVAVLAGGPGDLGPLQPAS